MKQYYVVILVSSIFAMHASEKTVKNTSVTSRASNRNTANKPPLQKNAGVVNRPLAQEKMPESLDTSEIEKYLQMLRFIVDQQPLREQESDKNFFGRSKRIKAVNNDRRYQAIRAEEIFNRFSIIYMDKIEEKLEVEEKLKADAKSKALPLVVFTSNEQS